MPDPYLAEYKTTPLHEYQCSLRILIRFNPALLIPTVYNAWYIIALLQNSSICYEEGLTLETLALETLYGSQFTSSTQLIIPICHFIPLAHAAPQFLMVLWNVPPPPFIPTILHVWKWILEQYLSHVTNAHVRFSEVSYHFG